MKDAVFAILGLAAALVIMMIVQMISGIMYPPPADLNMRDSVELARWMGTLPIGALLMVLLSYALGALAAGWIIGRFTKTKPMMWAAMVGAILTTFGFANLMSIPHPLWFSIVSTLSYIPMAMLGLKLGLRG